MAKRGREPFAWAKPPALRLEIPVRWGDMDALGHVNNTKLFQFCESGRIAYFEALGLDRVRARESEGPGLVAADLAFVRQLKYPATVAVEVSCTALGARALTLTYAIRDLADGVVVAHGESVCVVVDYAVARAVPLSEAVRAAIARLEGALPPPPQA